MKLCCCSRSYARVLQSGALTQLEWVDRCAELGLDGVEFGASHFPRADSDYLAQLKKLCVDRGLTAASVAVDVAFGDGDIDRQTAHLVEWIERAVALGAPLLRFACGTVAGSPGIAWREFVRGLKLASAEAKRQNVTLAMEPHPSTLVATPADAKRAIKECDSAWLRLAPELAQAEAMIADAVIVVARGDASDLGALPPLRGSGYIGFVSIESTGDDEDANLKQAVARLRPASA